MPPVTTIKVPVMLRDRLAERARRHNISSLAATVEELLQLAEAQEFWAHVNARHDELSDGDRAAYLNDPTLVDGLRNAIDDETSARDAW